MQNQESLQYVLLMIALVCVPMMLIPKPLIIWLQSGKKHSHEHHQIHEQNSEAADLGKKLNE